MSALIGPRSWKTMQQLIADSLDDLLRTIFPKILRRGQRVRASKGWNKELTGVVLELRNPLARLSRTETKGTVFSCLGETLWYLAKSNELAFIKYYISIYGRFAETDGTVHGAYGPRLFGMRARVNQIDNVIKLLRRKPNSRQAVVQLFNAEDLLKDYNDIPCTCTMQFFVRNGSLNAVVHMRSNDAFIGLPHDIFAFTFIQELVARSLGLKLGAYKHMVGSLHIYDADKEKVSKFLKEAYQSRISMPRMPAGDPWPNLKKLSKIEARIRQGYQVHIDRYKVPSYWSDLMRLLQIFALNKARKSSRAVKAKMVSSVYDAYIDKSLKRVS
jgi:thymidylate synthase